AVCLARPVVGILAEDHHPHPIEWRRLERAEDLPAGRKHLHAGPLALAQVVGQLAHLRTGQVVAYVLLPGRFELDAAGAGRIGAGLWIEGGAHPPITSSTAPCWSGCACSGRAARPCAPGRR